MACTKHCIVLVSIIYLLSVKVSIGAHLSQVHRREVQSTKQEKPKPTEASTVSGVPSVRPIIENTDRECTRFEHSYCNSQYGYQHGLFPNHKGQTAEQAAAELDHFAQLFNSGCSDKIGVFLCFTYFPLCIPPTKDGTQLIGGAQLEEVLPCKETCEEVHKSECTEYVLNATRGTGWADHLSCNQDIFKPKSSKQCATGESDSDDEDSTDSVDSKSEICPSESKLICSQRVCVCRDGTMSSVFFSVAVRCQSRCVARKNCNRGTFKNTKNQYKFGKLDINFDSKILCYYYDFSCQGDSGREARRQPQLQARLQR